MTAFDQKRIGQAVQNLNRGEIQSAERLSQEILDIEPSSFDGLQLLGAVRLRQSRWTEAATLFRAALAQQPQSADAHRHLALALHALGQTDEAEASLRVATTLSPQHVLAWEDLARLLSATQRDSDLRECLDRGLAFHPGSVALLQLRAASDATAGRHIDAIAGYDRILKIVPGSAKAHSRRAFSLFALGRSEEALAGCDAAISADPAFVTAYFNRGQFLANMGRFGEALPLFEKAFSMQPHFGAAFFQLQEARLRLCIWDTYDNDINRVLELANSGTPVTPYTLSTITDDASLLLRCAERDATIKVGTRGKALHNGERYSHRRIRLAYVAGDFHDHPVAHCLSELIERHDRSQFEVIGFSYGRNTDDSMRRRLLKSFDAFLEVSKSTDEDIAQNMRAREIDIAVDLSGLTASGRPRIFAHRPAPVQISFLGNPGTTGASHIDYFIGDTFTAPPGAELHYSEKLIRLPEIFFPAPIMLPEPAEPPTRTQYGLPKVGFVFCCFNGLHRLQPHVFEIWMRLLTQVDKSVLWLRSEAHETEINLRNQAVRHGVNPDRLVFADKVVLSEHLARHALADLYLDTFPYTAGTTATSALWSELPLLTCVGESFVSRICGTQLNALNLSELITYSLEEYEDAALRLARTPGALTQLRRKLRETKKANPLFDLDRYRRHIEVSFKLAHERAQRGEPPAVMTIPPLEL